MSLIENNSLFNTLDLLPEGYFILDQEFKVIYWNKAIEVLTTIEREHILNKNLDDVFKNFKKDTYRIRINPIYKGGPPVVFSAKLHKNLFAVMNSNAENYFQVTISALRASEGVYYALFSVENRNEIYNQINQLIDSRDKALTEINKKEEVHTNLVNKHIEIQEAFESLSEKNQQIEKQKQQLLELNATKDKFFSIIAHDLINPFSFLMGYTGVLYEKFDSYQPNELKEMLGHLNQTSIQTYDLLQNLLQWSRAQSGKIVNKPIKIFLKEIIDNNFELFKNNLNEKGIKISQDIPTDLYLFVDYNMVNTVFRNLISNAIKFTHQGGKIRVSIDNMNDSYVTVLVSDTGVGMDQEKINKLFKIEESTSTIGTSKEKGTGLGLLLCKEFTESMEGDLSVESKVGEGSTFIIKLPIWQNK